MALTKSAVLDLESTLSQYASIAHASQTGLSLTGSFSVMFWVKFESTPSNNARYAFVSKYDVGVAGYEVNFFVTGGGTSQLEVRLRQNGSTEDVKVQNFSTVGLGLGWHHIAITADYTSTLAMRMYVDGFDRAGAITGSTTAIGANASDFTIGARSGGTNCYDGLISDVRIWNVVLTADEVVSAMRHSGDMDGLQGNWKLNGGYEDNSKNTNHLTASGSPSFNTTDLPFATYGRTTRFFMAAGDGNVDNTDSSFSITRSAADGDAVSATAATFKVQTSKPFQSGDRTIKRGFLPFFTANFDSDTQVVGGAIGLVPTATSAHNAGESTRSSSIGLVQATQASGTTLAVADFDQCGTLNSAPEGSARLVVSNGTTSFVYTGIVNWMNLNSTGVGWISKDGFSMMGLRTSRDLDNLNYGADAISEDSITINASETSGTVNDPFADVVDDDTYYGGDSGTDGTATAGDGGGLDLHPIAWDLSPIGEYTPPESGGGSGGTNSPAAFLGALIE